MVSKLVSNQSHRDVLVLISHLWVLCLILAVAHAHHAGIVRALGNPFHEKLLDGTLGAEQDMSRHVGVAESTAGKIAVDSIGVMKDGSGPEHGFLGNNLLVCHY